MTQDEWDKYVQKIAQSVSSPSCDAAVGSVEKNFNWKSERRQRKLAKRSKYTTKVAPQPRIEVVGKYETKVYEYNGKYYQRRWVANGL
jgi:hypothetical protein